MAGNPQNPKPKTRSEPIPDELRSEALEMTKRFSSSLRLKEALEVSVAELLGSEPQTARRKPGPASQLKLRMERIKRLPRKEQEFVLRFLDTVLERPEQG